MSEDLKKMFWTGVAIIVIVLFATSVIKPTKNKIRGLESEINAIDYSTQ